MGVTITFTWFPAELIVEELFEGNRELKRKGVIPVRFEICGFIK